MSGEESLLQRALYLIPGMAHVRWNRTFGGLCRWGCMQILVRLSSLCGPKAMTVQVRAHAGQHTCIR